jgi:hypothetical protein
MDEVIYFYKQINYIITSNLNIIFRLIEIDLANIENYIFLFVFIFIYKFIK